MQFVCDRCKTKYEIDEARVRGKSLKIRCRSCGNIVEVRDPRTATQRAGGRGVPPKPPGRGAAGRTGAGASLGERFQRSFEGRGAAAQAVQGAATGAGAGTADRGAADRPEEATHIMLAPFLAERAAEVSRKLARWHVAIRNQPMGPMSEEAIRRHIEDGAVFPGTLVWREGLDEWRPLKAVKELGYLLETKPAVPTGRVATPAARESIFDLPPMRGDRSMAATVVPPPPLAHGYLLNGVVAVVSFALGMLFMYVLGVGSGAQQDESGGSSRRYVPPGAGEETPGSTEALPTIRSGALTITLTNPTIVAEDEPSPQGAAGGGMSRGGTRSSGGSGGRSPGGGAGATGGSGAYAPTRELGGPAGSIRTSGAGAAITVGGAQPRPLTGEQILPVVQAGRGGIELCYNQARVRDGMTDLSMRLTIDIATDGSVRRASLRSDDYITPELDDCIVGRVQNWRFPRATATSRVVLPFTFHER